MKQNLENLFDEVRIERMQSNKASKKTRKSAEGTVTSAPEIAAAAEGTAKPRPTRSSKTKKSDAAETGSVRLHRSATTSVPETATVNSAPPALAATASASAAPSLSTPEIIDAVNPVSTTTAPVSEAEVKSAPASVSYEEIAKLAHSYWAARGYAHGHAEEDWLRAERELTGKQ
jgi:hypothetical protein